MRTPLPEKELQERIALSFKRLQEPYYQIGHVFSPSAYGWQGDKEGRALLAFVSLYKLTGQKIACMDELLAQYSEKANVYSYFGPIQTNIISEQCLSGHSWVLRGLCEHYEQFHDDFSLQTLKTIAEKLYLPLEELYETYPLERENVDRGGVSGTDLGVIGRWLLSTDVGCAFMAVDGLSHVYKITRDARVKTLLDVMIRKYLSIDKVAIRAQTHCTLTIARGMARMYTLTEDSFYLEGADSIYELYVHGGGMTYTYQNLNWWKRPDTWTEPCAVIDSLMLASELYKATGKENYRKMAARIYMNGFATLQRENGGAGTDTIVTAESPCDFLAMKSYEAPFCCTMRLAEGLWYISEHKELLYTETSGTVTKDMRGVYSDDDVIYTEITPDLVPYAEAFTEIDGHKLCPIVKYYRVPSEFLKNAKQKIIFI
ncbi:MAG: hypothetical protein IJ489_00470 [Clostridia bacterium]|nr:hypothetical protein [Clostridia bacterium]